MLSRSYVLEVVPSQRLMVGVHVVVAVVSVLVSKVVLVILNSNSQMACVVCTTMSIRPWLVATSSLASNPHALKYA